MRYTQSYANRIRRTAAILAGVGMLWVAGQATKAAAEEEHSCSTAGVAGEWAYTETGTAIPATGAVPFAAVARYTLYEDGEMSGTATSSSGGTASNVTLKGTGTVNADCTSTLTVGVYAAGNLVRTATFQLVYVNGERQARAIISSLVLASGVSVPAVLTADATRVFHGAGR
ncbi:MAG: hypothetical protein QOH85_570 [Acidobacteriaceae bacterium]|jgi:hypothetical protein|nr:hypothetical protein [Acidobacteriaceae bacterium]